jgi:hypothetical protein
VAVPSYEGTLIPYGDQESFLLYARIPDYPAWVVEVVVRLTESGPIASNIQVSPAASFAQEPDAPEELRLPAGGIPTRLLRQINVGQLLALAQEIGRQQGRELAAETQKGREFVDYGDGHILNYVDAFRDLGEADRTRPGRRGNGIDHYLVWAVRYDLKVRASCPHPIAELAEEHGESKSYIRDTIADARRRYGLLTTAGQGRAGGTLTKKALALLAERRPQGGVET